MEGTHLMCETDALGTWLVLDIRKRSQRLAGPFFKISQAKGAAECLVMAHPALYRVEP
jgi:hypothetical protein